MTASRWLLNVAWTLWVLVVAPAAYAALTDISDVPLETSSASDVKPNVMFVLDDSGSMDWDYLPDYVNDAFCKTVDGGYTAYCCRNDDIRTNANGNGSGSNSCWGSNAPFGTWRGHPPFMSPDFNNVYYNPEITYTPPVVYKDADPQQIDTIYPNQTTWTAVKDDAYGKQSTSTTDLTTQFPDMEWCTDTTYTDCLRNDNYILPATILVDGVSKTYKTFRAASATGTGQVISGPPDKPTLSSRSFGPHYYRILPGEYCNSENLRTCQYTETAEYKYPARVRWCSDTALTTCQAVKNATYKYPRYPTRYYSGGTPAKAAIAATVTFTVSNGVGASCSSSRTAKITAVNVNGVDILPVDTADWNNASNTSAALRAASYSGGYSVDTSVNTSSRVKLVAPLLGGVNIDPNTVSITSQPVKNTTCSYRATSITVTPYVPAVEATEAVYYGAFVRTDIVPGQSYPKAKGRTDCAGTSTCTYDEEMTNFANWWTYYHTRMQMMKTSASLAFSSLDDNYRVGFFTINTSNNKTGSNFLDIGTFDFKGTSKSGSTASTRQKFAWYQKLFEANPSGSTPLRTALTKAGRIYGGKVGTNPVQYSCQQNFTILSSDGYWNEADSNGNWNYVNSSGQYIGGYQLDGTTNVGNPDGTGGTGSSVMNIVESPPRLDGTDTSNTLADVAEYYYATDLRTSDLTNCTGAAVKTAETTVNNDVCDNDVPISSFDSASWQHMTTFTLGLGIPGYMQFTPGYENAISGDFFDVKNQTAANPSNGVCTWQTSGTCNWPVPKNNDQPNIDDLWHAAVNGRGIYYSAGNPAALDAGLRSVLQRVTAQTGASSAATTSSPNLTSGDNYIFSSTFTTVDWDGQLIRQQLDLSTITVPVFREDDPSTYDWAARAQLDAQSQGANYLSRKIYLYDANSAQGLRLFTWGNLTSTEQGYFKAPHISTTPPSGVTGLSQFCTTGSICLANSDQDDSHAGGSNLVNFLRGDSSNIGDATDTSKYYRLRTHVLGDIVHAEPVYVRASQFKYADAGFSEFALSNDSRQGMVYAAANDGMLHAFYASTGSGDVVAGREAWAYIPSAVLPRLFKLADKNYANQHRYYVDGTPLVADAYFGGVWHTVLVAGLGAGGRAYYALDITDPFNPKALWEFTDTNLGYTFGNPVITKLKNGTWVAIVSSGYNNVSPGDGVGRLYVLNLETGAIIRQISTGVGSTTTPSGLARINAWADDALHDNITLRVYGGDLLGNLWRFDINGDIGASGYDAQLLVTVKDSDGVVQPITVRPELGRASNQAMVFVGTGRYLGEADVAVDANTQQQSFYAVRDQVVDDPQTAVDESQMTYSSPRINGSGFVQQFISQGTCPDNTAVCKAGAPILLATNNTVNLATDSGWFFDLPEQGERANTDPTLVIGTLAFSSNVPGATVCASGGHSYLYFLDYRTGSFVSSIKTGNIVGRELSTNLSSRVVVGVVSGGSTVIAITKDSQAETITGMLPPNPNATVTRRVSWRELINNR